jgi:dephospho-CoA kinase
MRLKDFILESINDKALMKAVFFVGYPGSGKTTISRLVTDGSLPIMSISSDIWTEWLGDVKGETEWKDVGGKVKKYTIQGIVNNTDGLLPVFVDTTGANIVNFKERVKILEDIGYDISMVIVDVKLETSAERVAKRNKQMTRQVGKDFIMKAHAKISKSIPEFKSVVPNNITVKNDVMDDSVILKAYRSVVKFFNKPIQNPKGKKLVDYMKENGYKYYREVPEDWKAANNFPVVDANTMKWFRKS